jgi:pyruvate dehydrogenase E2 component (dihydrolipoamide acetyltransferase)
MQTFNLPDLGEGLQDAEVVTWHVKPGDEVKVDDPLVSVETAKSVVDVPSPYAGHIAKLHAEAGDIVETGKPLVDFEDISKAGAGAPKQAAEPEAEAAPAANAEAEEPVREDSGTVVGQMQTSDETLAETAIVRKKRKKKSAARVKALPATRALAKQLEVDLADIEPTGKNETVTQDDVRQYAEAGAAEAPREASAPQRPPQPARTRPGATPSAASFGAFEPLRGPRRSMAQSMARARDEVSQCTIFDDADIQVWLPGQDMTVRIIRAIAAGCHSEPGLNAWYDGEQMARRLFKQIDLAMAVDTPEGLIVPVLRDIGGKDAAALRAELNEIKRATRERSIAPDDMKDPTITLSNFGMMAGRYATPVVVPPTVAILGTGGVRHDVVAIMGGVETHRRVPLSLTFDHRCITGGEACRFLAAVIADLDAAS